MDPREEKMEELCDPELFAKRLDRSVAECDHFTQTRITSKSLHEVLELATTLLESGLRADNEGCLLEPLKAKMREILSQPSDLQHAWDALAQIVCLPADYKEVEKRMHELNKNQDTTAMPGETKDAQKEEDNGVNDEILPCKQIESDWESDDVHAAEPVTKCAKNKNLAPKIQKGVIAKALSILALIQTHILSGEAKIDATGSVREGYLGFTKLWVRQPNFQNAIKSLKGTAPWANTRKLTTMDGHLKMVYEAFNVFRLGVDRKADKRKAQGKLAAPEYRFKPKQLALHKNRMIKGWHEMQQKLLHDTPLATRTFKKTPTSRSTSLGQSSKTKTMTTIMLHNKRVKETSPSRKRRLSFSESSSDEWSSCCSEAPPASQTSPQRRRTSSDALSDHFEATPAPTANTIALRKLKPTSFGPQQTDSDGADIAVPRKKSARKGGGLKRPRTRSGTLAVSKSSRSSAHKPTRRELVAKHDVPPASSWDGSSVSGGMEMDPDGGSASSEGSGACTESWDSSAEASAQDSDRSESVSHDFLDGVWAAAAAAVSNIDEEDSAGMALRLLTEAGTAMQQEPNTGSESVMMTPHSSLWLREPRYELGGFESESEPDLVLEFPPLSGSDSGPFRDSEFKLPDLPVSVTVGEWADLNGHVGNTRGSELRRLRLVDSERDCWTVPGEPEAQALHFLSEPLLRL